MEQTELFIYVKSIDSVSALPSSVHLGSAPGSQFTHPEVGPQQRSRNSRMVQWKGKLTDQGVRPVWQRQSRARAERDSWSCLDWLSRSKNWSLPCRDSPEREQREIPGSVWEQFPGLDWEQDLIEMYILYIWRCIWFKEKYKIRLCRCKWWMAV